MTPPISSMPDSSVAPLQPLPPRQRVFLPQTRRDRWRSFWWSAARATLFRWSPPLLAPWRAALLRLFGASVGPTTWVAPTTHIDYPWNLTMGENVVIAEHVIINCMGKVTIGDRTRISQYSHLCAGTHDYKRRDMKIVCCPIAIGTDVWIAADAFVGPGVTIADGCVVGARASVFRNLPPGFVCLGEPARPCQVRRQRP